MHACFCFAYFYNFHLVSSKSPVRMSSKKRFDTWTIVTLFGGMQMLVAHTCRVKYSNPWWCVKSARSWSIPALLSSSMHDFRQHVTAESSIAYRNSYKPLGERERVMRLMWMWRLTRHDWRSTAVIWGSHYTTPFQTCSMRSLRCSWPWQQCKMVWGWANFLWLSRTILVFSTSSIWEDLS